MSFLKRLFGIFRSPAAGPADSAPRQAAPATPPPRRLAITWQEMLDSQPRIAGYLLRPTALTPGTAISGQMLHDALDNEGVARLAERRRVIIPITHGQWREADFRPLAAKGCFFLLAGREVHGLGPDTWQELVCDIRAAGGMLAVDAEIHAKTSHDTPPGMLLLDLAAQPLSLLETTIRRVRQQQPATTIVVDGVNDWAEYRFLQSIGVACCVGPFAATPDHVEHADQISQSRLVVIEMLNLLRREADAGEIAAVAKRDPGVVLKLIEMANSPLSGLSRKVATLEEAIMLLGREAIYRWLALAMFRIDGRGNRDETLMIIALSRAAFLEGLAAAAGRRNAGELFLVGLFSLIESLLQMPLDKILPRIHLPDDVVAALLRTEGPYAHYLMLSIAMERCQLEQAVALCALLGIAPGDMLAAYSDSMTWATTEALG